MHQKLFFDNVRTIAIVGLSDNLDRPSYIVAEYLQSNGFKIIPVNPKVSEVLGEKAYPDLLSIPRDVKVDVVDIFRRSVMPHVKEAVERGDVHTVWMQEGIVHGEAEKYAKEHGINVIMDFCMMKTHQNQHA
jgi:predicted CoA-binding protein